MYAVTAICEWPSASITARMGMPRASMNDEAMRATQRIFGGYRTVFGLLAAKMAHPEWSYPQAAKMLPPVDQTIAEVAV